MIDYALNLVLFAIYIAALPTFAVVYVVRKVRRRRADDGLAERQVAEAETPSPVRGTVA